MVGWFRCGFRPVKLCTSAGWLDCRCSRSSHASRSAQVRRSSFRRDQPCTPDYHVDNAKCPHMACPSSFRHQQHRFSPHGAEIPLKASVDISGYTPQQQVILKAMKKYGMILADNNGNKAIWGLSATDDSRWDIKYNSFEGIHGSDFEAVDESSLMIDEDSGKARVTSGSITSITTPSITITSPAGGETWTRVRQKRSRGVTRAIPVQRLILIS